MHPLLILVGMGLTAHTLLPGAELVIRDIQADVLLPPTRYDFTLSTPGGSQTGTDGFSTGTALAIGGRYSMARPGDAYGLIAGLDLEVAGYANHPSQLLDWGGRASVGAGYAITDAWVASLTGGYAYGRGSFTASASNGAPQIHVRGAYHGEDVSIEIQYHLTRALAVEVGGGYWVDSHHLTGASAQLQLDRAGLFVGGGLIWRLFSAPERIK